VPYVVEGPDGPLYADFHALRHSYIALLDRSGATLKEAMQLARHSDPKLTMAVYGRAQLHDLGAAVDRLTELLPDAGPEGQALQATGKDSAPPASLAYPQLTPASDRRRESLRENESAKGEEGGKENRPQL